MKSKNKIISILGETWLLITLALIFGSAALVGVYHDEYMAEYKRANEEFAKKDELNLSGLTFTKIDDYL